MFVPHLYSSMQPGQRSGYSDSVRAGRSGDRNPVEARLSVPVQNGLKANPASFILGNRSSPEVKGPGRGGNHPPPSNAEVANEIDYRATSHVCLHAHVMG